MKKFLILITVIIFILSCNTSATKKTVQIEESSSTEKIIQDSIPQSPKINIKGIDISHHQSNINWDTLKKSDIEFIFIKATGGLDYTDPKFPENWKNAKQTGFLRGAYHFYYAVDDPEKQARFFSKTVLAVSDSLDLPPVLDIETHGVNSAISVAQYQNDVKKWLELVEADFKRKPIIYTSKNFANKYLKNHVFSTYHLWLAEYEVEAPTVPETWKSAGWTFWQNTYSDTITGIKGRVDHNIFAGTIEKLQHLGY